MQLVGLLKFRHKNGRLAREESRLIGGGGRQLSGRPARRTRERRSSLFVSNYSEGSCEEIWLETRALGGVLLGQIAGFVCFAPPSLPRKLAGQRNVSLVIVIKSSNFDLRTINGRRQ